MKRALYAAAVLFLGISALAGAENQTVTNQHNHYGGKTIIYTYSSGDESFKKGVARTVAYQDRNGNVMKSENFLTEEFARKKGNERFIIYGSGERIEVYHTDEYARRHDGAAKTVRYRDGREKQFRADGSPVRMGSR